MTAAEQLYLAVAELAPSVNPRAALALGRDHWDELSARDPNPHDAETCRLLSLASIEQAKPDFPMAELWRMRALARFALTGWHEGVAAIAMGRAFTALSTQNNDYSLGKTLDVIEGSQTALELLEDLELFLRVPPSGITVGPRSPSQTVLRRFLHEKRGFLLLALGRVQEATASYDQAEICSRGNPRGEVKVQLGRALVVYMAGDVARALMDTREALGKACELREADLVKIGGYNIAVMERSGRDLRPYEIL